VEGEAAMTLRNRREFLADVSRGMLVAGVGWSTALDLRLASARAAEEPATRLSFGALDPLVDLLQATPLEQLLPAVVAQIKQGTSLKDLTAAGALANARSFGGEDYVGFHTLMALGPAYHMSQELATSDQTAAEQSLPVLKVLYRNTQRIQEAGGAQHDALTIVEPAATEPDLSGLALRDAVRAKDLDQAERLFAGIAAGTPQAALNALLTVVEDDNEVHRVALPYRAYTLIDLVGAPYAHSLLRQSLRYCIKSERSWTRQTQWGDVRQLLPQVFDRHHLAGMTLGTNPADDLWITEFVQTLMTAAPDQAADAVGVALSQGMSPEHIGEAITLAANQLVLRDPGRDGNQEQPGKPIGSVHGDSIGVHGCDCANAWRTMSRFGDPHQTAACLIMGAFQVARDRVAYYQKLDVGQLPAHPLPYPSRYASSSSTAADLLARTDEAIRSNLQARAAALVQRYGELGFDAAPMFGLMRKYAISEDGALHAEKFYGTVREEFASTRASFRWRHLIALARVTASEHGRPAAGVAEARALLG
jgi:hypothetical protein